MICLPEPPRLIAPTPSVRVSYLVGEQADCIARRTPTDWLDAASTDFDEFVSDRLGVRMRYGVPSTAFWFVSGEFYLGSLALRHHLTPELEDIGGHIGYHVVAPWQRQGHATRMLGAGLREAAKLGLDRVLLTCESTNEPSRKVILANGGVPDAQRQVEGENRFWINL